ncbi:Eco57I restriction-modification methylase domain-containing protein [Streptococcus ferus]|uniref:Type II restriction-modification system restriction subunit n=1 Tax=Streptococcus ferus TaxID=1345 RepID=A0A2X3W0X4_9STRE|nr:Eco57I restriction-modification methylase domain-containing protein [Streptococcus ferus]SQF40919.1 type II restriction-modification system restriction subunit [Streptococcus ferus]
MTEPFKFDVVIGNPPYQEEAQGKRPEPIYHLFLDESNKLSNKVIMIHPARFLFEAGQTPKAWNKKVLNDEHFKVVYYEQDSSKIFPNTDIKGGIAITYRDNQKVFGAIRTFTVHKELNHIVSKIVSSKNFESINKIMYGFNSYKLTEKVYKDYPIFEERVVSPQTRMYMLTNIFTRLPEIFFDTKQSDEDVQIIGRENSERSLKYINRNYIIDHANLDKYKVILPGSNGSGAIGEALSTPLIGEPLIGHTQTFISFGAFDNKRESEYLLKYIKTKFARVMLGTMKITQHNETASTWKNVPLQDFTPNSDIDWSQSISEIDQQLYKKYGLSQDEIDFIEEKVKEMK